MSDHILPAFVVFGVLFLIAAFGRMRSSAASRRLHGSTRGQDPLDPQTGASFPGTARR